MGRGQTTLTAPAAGDDEDASMVAPTKVGTTNDKSQAETVVMVTGNWVKQMG